ncbi:monovalent cation/H+ antiporter subunit E [Corynebacterium epidermidicanis]|uniref:Multisubunit sodium/proton antiporter, MrpE subunit n=1 Tax=Corynebacterium epidermidicanis TaxID=1050174 RepID=A0A0G3GRJ1_9CORY|nr:monovalent cation/H+ antiporter subunit E [Corynebacterium epidermidicanis]AKK02148.1 multisubunit sodium/proton antiporter, MrpE subunit [Corynebacterium epidermidicanis]
MHLLKFIPWLIGQIFVGGVVIVRDSFSPGNAMQPVIVSYPLRVTSERDIFWFSTCITITPGTLSLGLRDDRLLVHAVYGADPGEVLAGLADMEERLVPSIRDIDRGAPGQGPGNPLHSTFVAGHSDTNYGPYTTEER